MNYKDYNDNELLFLIKEKNEDANDIIYKKYKPLIVSLSKKLSQGLASSGVEINDLIQEGMLGLNQAITNFNEDKDVTFYTFAKTCIERRMFSLIISTKRLKHKFLNEAYSLDFQLSDGDSISIEEVVGTSDTDPEVMIIDKEKKEELLVKITSVLTEKEEKVFMLKANNFDYTEIAEMLDITPKSVDNTLQRIKNKVRKILEEKRN